MFRASTAALRQAGRVQIASLSHGPPRLQPVTVAKPWLLGIQLRQRPPPTASQWQVARFASKSDPEKHKEEVIKDALKPRPDEVSTTSSTRHVYEPSTPGSGSRDPDMKDDLKQDLHNVQDTFSLKQVPRESHILGLMGTVPYFATSLSTLYLAWDLNKFPPTGSAFTDSLLISHETARYLVDLIEPLQIGYGAVIISFLGAIHWGLEYAEKQPMRKRTRFRYGMGLAASVLAWPTLLMPFHYALISQFSAFAFLYFCDARATTRGWAPAWYGTYRFLLTAMVGVAIFISLVGRTKISQHGRLTEQGISKPLHNEGIADHETDWVKIEAEDKRKMKKEKEEAEKKAKREAELKKRIEEKGGKKKQGKSEGKSEGKEEDKSEEDDGEDESKDEKKEESES